MQKRSTKRTLISSVLVIVLCFAMLIGTTYAWFTDSVTSGNNVIKAGNLDIEVEYTLDGKTWNDLDGAEDLFTKGLWEPGHTEVVALRVTNAGSLALKYKAHMNIIEEITGKSVLGGDIVLSEILNVSTLTQQTGTIGDITVNLAFKGENRVAYENTASFKASNVLKDEYHLLPGDAQYLIVKVDMPESVGNEANHDGVNAPSIEFGLDILATQYTKENDSFDSNYDKDAIYPNSVSANIGGGDTIAQSDASVTLPAGLAKGDYTLTVNNKSKVVGTDGLATLSMDIDLMKNGVKVEKQDGVAYTLSMNVGTGLVVTGATHNGEAIEEYSYNPSTGVITFTTDSFSPFAVSYSTRTVKVKTYQELYNVLDEIKVEAKKQIPGENGNKAYREAVTIVLEDDIVIDADSKFMYTDSNGAPLHIYGMKGVIDLNGHNITVAEDALLDGKAYANAVLLFQYSNVSIIGEGSIYAYNKSIPVYAWANCTVDIYGGNYKTNAFERNESAVYVNNKTALVNVYGGTYTESEYAFNVHDNCGSTTTIVLHEGITYADFLKNGTTDVIKSDLNNGRIAIADGCELVKADNNINTVTKK